MNENYANFTYCPIDVHSHETGPFFYINQFNHCTTFITVPLAMFLKVMAARSDYAERFKLITLNNTGRCGSTLLTQLFENSVQGTVSISEPEILVCMVQAKKKPGSFATENRTALLKASINILCMSATRRPGYENTTCVIIKPKAHAIAIPWELGEIFPDMKQIYMFRHPVDYVNSLQTVFISLLHPIARSKLIQRSVGYDMAGFILTHFDDTENDPYNIAKKIVTHFDLDHYPYRFACLYVANMLGIRYQRTEKHVDFKVVSYHELVAKPKTTMRGVFEFCGLPDVSVENISENDSQKNSGLSRQTLTKFKKSLSEAEIEEVDKVLKMSGFPDQKSFPLDAETLTQTLLTARQTV